MHTASEKALEHLNFLAGQMRRQSVDSIAMAVLLELNIPTNHAAFDYLLKAVVAHCGNPLLSVSEIYPVVAAQYRHPVSNEAMEQAIRGAIKKAWKNRNEFVWKCYFSQATDGSMKRPTNSEFISRIGRVLQLLQKCGKREVGYEKVQ